MYRSIEHLFLGDFIYPIFIYLVACGLSCGIWTLFFKYQGSLFLGVIFNLWLQIIRHYLENKRSHYLHSSLQPQSYTLFSHKIRVGRGLRRYTEEKSKREQTLLQAYRPSYREGYVSG